MVETSIKEFLATGQIGPVTLGMTRRRVARLLGDPDDAGPDVTDSLTIWKYGDIEMIFGAKGIRLNLIDFHAFDGVPCGGRKLRVDPWIVLAGLSRRSLESALRNADIPFGLTDWNTRPWGKDNTVRLWCGARIEIILMCPKGDWPTGFYGAFFAPEPQGWEMLDERA